MEEQEKKQTKSDDPPDQKTSVTSNKPDEPHSVDNKGPKDAKPKRQNDNDQKEKVKELLDKYRSTPIEIILDCLKRSFSEQEIRELCLTKFEDVHRNLKEIDRLDSITERLVSHCDRRSSVDVLWECIRINRPSKYEEFYPKWQEAMEAFGNPNDQFGDVAESTSRQGSPASDDEAKDHVLSRDDKAAINSWFHNKLDPQERSMVLTVALFQGINRKYMASISDEIRNRLFEMT